MRLRKPKLIPLAMYVCFEADFFFATRPSQPGTSSQKHLGIGVVVGIAVGFRALVPALIQIYLISLL